MMWTPWRSRWKGLGDLGGLVLALMVISGCTTAAWSPTPRALRVAEGVYVMPGSGGVADEQNLGRIGNSGFIVGDTGVLAIDTGTSFLHGQALLAAVRAITPKPVRLALVTHTRPEFLFGGAAFQAAGIPVVMHRKTALLMAARCDNCLKQLRQTLGDEAMRGTTMFKADRQFDDSHRVDDIGRPVRVLHLGHASGPGDIAVFDERTGVLFGGGLLDAGRIPDIQDSYHTGWPQALAMAPPSWVWRVTSPSCTAARVSWLTTARHCWTCPMRWICPTTNTGTSTTSFTGAMPALPICASSASCCSSDATGES
jgi:glyoxylase-like metal-dependent hydrolase (beta-lactamase superfamily II)